MNTSLHNVAHCGIILTCLNHVEGGYSDTDGRITHRQGGSTEVEAVRRGREKIAEKWSTAWLYGSRLVAHQARSSASVLGETSQLHRREQVTGYFLPVAPRMSPCSSSKLGHDGIPELMLPVCKYDTAQQERQVPCAVIL